MISLDLLHGSLISLACSLIAYVTGHALHIAHTLSGGLTLDLEVAEVLSEGLADSLAVEVGFLVTEAGALGAAVVRLVALVGQLALLGLSGNLGYGLDWGVGLCQILELIHCHAVGVADAKGRVWAISLRSAS